MYIKLCSNISISFRFCCYIHMQSVAEIDGQIQKVLIAMKRIKNYHKHEVTNYVFKEK